MLNYKSFRRRWILLFILVVGCIVLLSNNLSKNSSLIEDDYETKHAIRRQPFQWKPNLPDVVSNNSTKIVPCRNSVQGKLIIVDERGYICNRTELDNRGCCDVTLFSIYQSIAVISVVKSLLTRVLEEARQLGDRSLASVGDQFELCLAKCRTSSQVIFTYTTKKPKVKKPEENPFKVLWMNSCYQQTLLPDAPWHKIEDKIAESLTLKVERQFGKPERKEALLQNLGIPFVSKYLPDADWNPQLLEPPNMAHHEKQKILKEAQAYLNSQMYKCVKDIGYQKNVGGRKQWRCTTGLF
ncbi:unnamed protein product [Mytilus edulis]|uniref:SREBP regulating gene protein n=1 Tax=Mytilus edulis TaxID=6550 RepID=A0A8S3RGS2_MYTED|nr:unnamed protein product [Mytilus edulis]